MSVSRKFIASVALSLTALGALGGIHAASAEPVAPTGSGSKGCPVVDSATGMVTYVPVGTVVFPFHCAPNGEWHFGWLTTDRSNPNPPTPTGPKTAVTATAVTNAARSAR